MCGNTNPDKNYKWFPDPDQADKIPDFEACKNYYGDWGGYCSSVKPADCDYKFDRHLLNKHFPAGIRFIGNHCRDGVKNYSETGVDIGPMCD
jgi:hypothetical protein